MRRRGRGASGGHLTPGQLVELVRSGDVVLAIGIASSAWLWWEPAGGGGALPFLLLLQAWVALWRMERMGLYREVEPSRLSLQGGAIARAFAWALILVLVLWALLRPEARVEAVVVAGLALASALALGIMRVVVERGVVPWLAACGRYGLRLVVFGAGAVGQEFVRHLSRAGGPYRLLGLFDDRRDRVPDYVGGYPVLGDLEGLVAFLARHPVDRVVVALPPQARERIVAVVERLAPLAVEVRLVLDPELAWLGRQRVEELAGLPAFALAERPLAGWRGLLKAAEDRLLAALALLALAPLLAAIALAIKLHSPGPVFYRQKRRGFAGEVIEVLKFRTLHAEACAGEGEEPVQVRSGDPRVTPLGRLLRRFSLDELPQLWNVLRGEMSIVGPRPHALAHDDAFARLVQAYCLRNRVKPGITGWAQVHGLRGEIRSLEDLRRRLAYDLDYVRNWSLGLDMKIILLTLLRGLYDRTA